MGRGAQRLPSDADHQLPESQTDIPSVVEKWRRGAGRGGEEEVEAGMRRANDLAMGRL